MPVAAKRIPDKDGNVYSLTGLASALCMSHTWAVRHQGHCTTFEEFKAQAVISNKYLKPAGVPARLAVDDIPVGSWERKNIKCPKVGTKTVSQIISEIDHEMYPDLLKEKLRSVERRKSKC